MGGQPGPDSVSGATVVAVSAAARHRFSKPNLPAIRLLAGLGVEGDAHLGATVQHRSRVRRDPAQPNLRQVHLIAVELFRELEDKGFRVSPGQMGENITTRGLDLLGLPTGTRLSIGREAVLEITGLRNPCTQLDDFLPGLMGAVLDRSVDGNLIRKAGVMGVVLAGGAVSPGDQVRVAWPEPPHSPLQPV